jgi:hypothetical protein
LGRCQEEEKKKEGGGRARAISKKKHPLWGSAAGEVQEGPKIRRGVCSTFVMAALQTEKQPITPFIAQLVEHLTVDLSRYQMVPGSIPGERNFGLASYSTSAQGSSSSSIPKSQKPITTTNADSTLRSSQAVPHPSTNRALRHLTSEFRRDPVHWTRYGRQRHLYLEPMN